MKDVELPSGRKLKVQLAPWEHGRDLYQTVSAELLKLSFNAKQEIDESIIIKIGALLLSSKETEKQIWACMAKALIDNERITRDSFEEAEHRADYLIVLKEVGWENVAPFMKSLYADYPVLLEMLKKNSQA